MTFSLEHALRSSSNCSVIPKDPDVSFGHNHNVCDKTFAEDQFSVNALTMSELVIMVFRDLIPYVCRSVHRKWISSYNNKLNV